MEPTLSLVIPVFNEADSLEPLVDEIDEALGAAGRAFRDRLRRRRFHRRLVRRDGGARRGARRRARRQAAAQLRQGRGAGARLRRRAAATTSSRLDGDRQDDPAEIPRLIAPLDEGYDLVSGWKQSRQDPLNKTLPSRFFNWTVRRTTGIPLHDFNCGLKAYRREVVETIHVYGEQHRYIPVVAAQAGFRVTEEQGEPPAAHRGPLQVRLAALPARLSRPPHGALPRPLPAPAAAPVRRASARC